MKAAADVRESPYGWTERRRNDVSYVSYESRDEFARITSAEAAISDSSIVNTVEYNRAARRRSRLDADVQDQISSG
jgi:hypothetical protein